MKLFLDAPHQVYRAADGRKLTGVTTYLGVLAKPALLGWYAQMERDGVLGAIYHEEYFLHDGDLLWAYGKNKDAENARRDGWMAHMARLLPTKPDGKPLWFAEAKRDRAADLGTVTHARCEAWNKGDPLGLEPDGIPADLYEQSVHGFMRYTRWLQDEGLTVVTAEEQFVYDNREDISIESPMAYGGTRDVVCVDGDGRRVLVDLKTSKASAYWPYDETYAQVAAYAHPPEAEIDRIAVVRIGTTPEDEGQHVWLSPKERAAGWDIFCGAYRSYEAKKALTRAKKENGR